MLFGTINDKSGMTYNLRVTFCENGLNDFALYLYEYSANISMTIIFFDCFIHILQCLFFFYLEIILRKLKTQTIN